VRVSFPEVQCSVEVGSTDVQVALRVFKCLAQAHSNDNTGRCRESDSFIRNRRLQPLRCAIEVAYVFASAKAIIVRFLVEENAARKELHPLELPSNVTTEFAYNGTSRGLHHDRYCRTDVISELKCM